jgi:hypothetical protein
MKYLIILIIIGLAIWGLITLLNGERSTISNDPKEATNRHRLLANEYLSKFKEGVLFPEVNVSSWGYLSLSPKTGCAEDAFIISRLNEGEFLELVGELALEKRTDLFEFWPDAFFHEAFPDSDAWDVTKNENEYTYYGENPDMQIRMAARYENHKIFIRTEANVTPVTNEKGHVIKTRVLERR